MGLVAGSLANVRVSDHVAAVSEAIHPSYLCWQCSNFHLKQKPLYMLSAHCADLVQYGIPWIKQLGDLQKSTTLILPRFVGIKTSLAHVSRLKRHALRSPPWLLGSPTMQLVGDRSTLLHASSSLQWQLEPL